MDHIQLLQTDPAYPARLHALLGPDAPPQLGLAGNRALLQERTLSLFCSIRCPGAMILQTYQLMRTLRRCRLAVISGFHSPMERECLRTLANGTAGIVWCLAKSLAAFRLSGEWQPLFESGRLLLVAPFPPHVTRITKATALFRNRVAAALADDAFLPYAAAGGRTEKFCQELLAWDKTVFTLAAPENAGIVERGAHALSLSDVTSFWPTHEVPVTGDTLL
ncbi:MAG: DNA-processing protein DprA [bacterium]|nr:DNA-processing protein DprA [bacterium]